MQFSLLHFHELTLEQWYLISQLRLEVFVVEQQCHYQDLDGKDLFCYHLSGSLDGKLVAYARIVPPDVSYSGYASIGRVVTHPSFRGKKYGRAIMQEAISECRRLYPGTAIKISAQKYLLEFYTSFGFQAVGEAYLEDNIPHQAMIMK